MRLRAEGVVEWRVGVVEIRDLARPSKLADFDPTYLRLWKEPV